MLFSAEWTKTGRESLFNDKSVCFKNISAKSTKTIFVLDACNYIHLNTSDSDKQDFLICFNSAMDV